MNTVKLLTQMIRVLTIVLLVSAIVLLKGCGADLSAPVDSIITINPSGKTWTVAASFLTGCPSPNYNDEVFAITVTDSDGNPLNDITITIQLDLSANSSPPALQCLELFDGDTGAQITSPYTTKTGDYGTKNIVVRMDFGETYRAELKVFSGTAYSSANLEVTS